MVDFPGLISVQLLDNLFVMHFCLDQAFVSKSQVQDGLIQLGSIVFTRDATLPEVDSLCSFQVLQLLYQFTSFLLFVSLMVTAA